MIQRFTTAQADELALCGNSMHRVVKGSVVFGQSSLGCKGNGICRVDMVTLTYYQQMLFEQLPDNSAACPSFPVELTTSNDKRLQMIIWKPSLTAKRYQLLFADGIFTVAEDYQLPNYLRSVLDLKINSIKKGKYTIKETLQTLQINF